MFIRPTSYLYLRFPEKRQEDPSQQVLNPTVKTLQELLDNSTDQSPMNRFLAHIALFGLIYSVLALALVRA